MLVCLFINIINDFKDISEMSFSLRDTRRLSDPSSSTSHVIVKTGYKGYNEKSG